MVKIKASCLDSGAIRSFSRVDLSRSPHVRCRVEITRQRIDVDWWHQSRDVFNTRVSIKGGGGGRRYRVAAISVRPLASRTFLSAGTLSIGDKKGRMAKCSARNRIEYPWRRDVDHRVYTPGIWYLVRGSPNLFVCIGDGKGNMRGILSGVEGGMGRDLWDLFFSLFLLLLWFGKIVCLGDYCYLFFLNILLKEGAFLQQTSIMTMEICSILKFWKKFEN